MPCSAGVHISIEVETFGAGVWNLYRYSPWPADTMESDVVADVMSKLTSMLVLLGVPDLTAPLTPADLPFEWRKDVAT